MTVAEDEDATIATKLGLDGDYALAWDEFIGQEAAKMQILTSCQAAKERDERLPHLLLASGEPGVGKTNLALLAAQEMGVEARIVSGKIKPAEALMILMEMQDREILIYEECHLAVAGGKTQAEGWMLHLMENGTIIGALGPEEVPDITIIGTTTEPGRFPRTLLERFELTPMLTKYSHEEATDIALGMTETIFEDYDLEAPGREICARVASAAILNPRMIRKVLKNMRDIAQVQQGTHEEHLVTCMSWLGLAEDGLGRTARRYLVTLRRLGGKAGERSLIDILGEPGGLGDVERVLVTKGLIAKTSGGRQLLGPGMKRALELDKEGLST